MPTITGSRAQEGPTFEEVIDENAPYIAALYVLNLVLLVAFIDHAALFQGELTYNALVGPEAAVDWFSQVTAGAFAAVFALVTLVGVVYAVSVLEDQRENALDPYDVEQRISTLTIVPALQLFAIILCPVLTRRTLVDGAQFLIGTVF
jgi:hypothetical protein